MGIDDNVEAAPQYSPHNHTTSGFITEKPSRAATSHRILVSGDKMFDEPLTPHLKRHRQLQSIQRPQLQIESVLIEEAFSNGKLRFPHRKNLKLSRHNVLAIPALETRRHPQDR
jgi:hypothetical protein